MSDEEDKDKSQATEDPTPKRIEDAYKNGQIIYSKDLINFLSLATILILILQLFPIFFKTINKSLTFFWSNPDEINLQNPLYISKIYLRSLKDFLIITSIILPITLISSVAPFIQNLRITFTTEALKFDISRISPLKGLARMFSFNTIVDLLKNLSKIIVVGIISYFVIKSMMLGTINLQELDVQDIIMIFKINLKNLVIKILIFLFFLGVFDYFYQRYKFFDNLKMSKQDIKDELKQSDINPEIKAKIRKLMTEKNKKRMMAEVPKADVIITNPTHYSIALKYDMTANRAPILIAKGVDKVALNIRKIANKHDIPIVENPPLARELYKIVEIDQEIPIEYYQTVAEIITYVYKLKGKEL